MLLTCHVSTEGSDVRCWLIWSDLGPGADGAGHPRACAPYRAFAERRDPGALDAELLESIRRAAAVWQ